MIALHSLIANRTGKKELQINAWTAHIKIPRWKKERTVVLGDRCVVLWSGPEEIVVGRCRHDHHFLHDESCCELCIHGRLALEVVEVGELCRDHCFLYDDVSRSMLRCLG